MWAVQEQNVTHFNFLHQIHISGQKQHNLFDFFSGNLYTSQLK